ncbi:serine/threonine-protein kinase [Pseudenhygromyxa sp. WMMC2535]|uniref:serine/threonine-protein kinase n=1 Tax=Pseudenhygromyxa sp. WMMC2535 TaxID=2712867 RepID=UPI0020D19A5A|nr:serine/threonine-protein kinase [Pseudenhygromyxa sp. WMMC2535]
MQPEADTRVLSPRVGQGDAREEQQEPVLLRRWVGRYELIQRLAHGGMATVYLGRAKGKAGFEKVVAVKVIHPHLASEAEFVGMFLDEARIAARIHHPHVVEILDLGRVDEGDGSYFMVMEFIEGENLAALVRALGGERLPISVILLLLADTLEGLGAAHDLRDGEGELYRLVHRDVSPHNILINLGGWAKVADFGIMKAAGKSSSTKTGELRGKLAYMSPEQARGGRVDLRTDLFAVGVVAWELLAGERLFACETEAATLEKVMACRIPALIGSEAEHARPELDLERWPERAELAEGLDALLARALDADPKARFESAAQMLTEVKRLARLCEDILDEDPEPRTYLSELMQRFFQARVDYARAALRRTGEYDALVADPEPRSAQARDDDTRWSEATLEIARPVTGSNPTLIDGTIGHHGDPRALTGPYPPVPTGSHPSLPGQDLRASASYPYIPAPPPASTWLMWLLLPMLGAGIAVAAMLVLSPFAQAPKSDPSPVQDQPQPQPLTPKSAATSAGATAKGKEPTDTDKAAASEVSWFITTQPPGATIRLEGEAWSDPTPTTVSLPRGDTTIDLTLELDGYKTEVFPIIPSTGQSFSHTFDPNPTSANKARTRPRVRPSTEAGDATATADTQDTPVFAGDKALLGAPDSLRAPGKD